MKIALAQINSLVGDIEGNKTKLLAALKKAKKLGADLVCFHELALTGYPPRDLLELSYFIDKVEKANAEIATYSKEITFLFGTVTKNTSNNGLSLFNSALWCQDGQVRVTANKSLLPSYDVFDEKRYFEKGEPVAPFDYKGVKVGLTICEDIWFDTFNPRPIYAANPVSFLADHKANLIFNLSASPYAMGKHEQRLNLLQNLAQKYPATYVYVNQVGGNDELIFDGGSMVMDRDSHLLTRAPFFKEGLTFVECPPNRGEVSQESPREIFQDDKDTFELQLLHDALILGLRDYIRKCGFKKVTLGLSGGIDSALVAYLAAQALGEDNVLGILMPSRYSSRGSVTDSKKLAKNLKIATQTIPINDIHKQYEKEFRKMFKGKKADITEENIQARIRGNLLMAISNKLGHLVLTTGNKSELAVGYCTLYGDMCGGLAVISDVQKTLVYALARYINRKKEIIPNAIIEKAPSAELKPHQTDQDSLPPYSILDGILKAYVEDEKSVEEIIKMGFDKKTVMRVISLIIKSEYKRRQAAPGLRVTSKAFGVGRRFPIAAKV